MDLRATGDGNPGAWNALEQLGLRRAWPAFALDGAKGAVAVALGWLMIGTLPQSAGAAELSTAWLAWACGLAAMLGHAFPPASPRRGGKGVMTFAGAAVALVPAAGAVCAAVFAACAACRRGSLGARVAVSAFPVAQAAFTPLVQVGWTGVLMTATGLLLLVRRSTR